MLGSRANNLDKAERKGFWKWDKDKTLQENVDHLNDVKAKYATKNFSYPVLIQKHVNRS